MEIEIFLIYDGIPKSILLIPYNDIQRLAVYPFRWLRYVMFAISGARGDLSTTLEGPYVDYDRTKFADDENRCYYWPSEDCAFIDYEGLNDRLTSTAPKRRRSGFRRDLIRRDGPSCVITEVPKAHCEAAHLIPRSKGDEYIARVLQLRSPGDNSAPLEGVRIDDARNRMLLADTLHSMLGTGDIAFIKTPNYGLDPKHIRRIQRGDTRPDYITLHWLKGPHKYDPTLLATIQTLQVGAVDPGVAFALGANIDALFQGEGGSPPSTVILDYIYGVAAFNAWQKEHDGDFEPMTQYREENYINITPLDSDTDDAMEPEDEPLGDETDDPNDETYDPDQEEE
ncbi:hypothetical protein BGW80DRAFT_1192203 [Lactifluus volemus]|nr:hypothetical protein BGW80DRAFT_1192203 [Lactifluus volemus]